MNPHLLVRYKVEDYDKWKAVFDSMAEARAAAGSLKGHVFQDADDPLSITVLIKFEDLERMQDYMNAPELQEAMKSAGVVSPPEIFVLGHEDKFVD